MVMEDSRKKYLKEYREKNLKRIPLDVSHDFYLRIAQHAAADGRSVNGYIKRVLALAMDAEDAVSPDSKSDEKYLAFKERLKAIGEISAK